MNNIDKEIETQAQVHSIIENISKILTALSERWPMISEYETIGSLQFVIWEKLPANVIDQIYKVRRNGTEVIYDLVDESVKNEAVTKAELEQILYEWQKGEVNNTINNLRKYPLIQERNSFEETVAAFNRGDYNLAAIGFTSVIDKPLAVFYGDETCTGWEKMCKALDKKAERVEDGRLPEADYIKLLLMLTFGKAYEKFAGISYFNEPEPDFLNRHWIMHGRTTRDMSELDCIKIINFAYGTFLMIDLAQQQ